MDSKSVLHAVSRGIAPFSGTSRLRSWRAVETTRINEHGAIKSVLKLMVLRLADCRRRVSAQADRYERDLPIWLGPELASSVIARDYVPRIDRLRSLAVKAEAIERNISNVLAQSLFDGVDDAHDVWLSPIFQNVVAYNACFIGMLQYLRTLQWTLDDGFQERIKLTSRLFEHWVYLQIAGAVASLGLECIRGDGFYSILSSDRFALDLDRGTTLEYRLLSGRLLRLRYEPWIFPQKIAFGRRDGLYATTRTAFSPDVVLEFCDGVTAEGIPRVTYAVVVDSKYTTRVGEDHWQRVHKYGKLRATCSDRLVSNQVWIAFASNSPAKIEEECIAWGQPGDVNERFEGTVGFFPQRLSEQAATIRVCDNARNWIRDLFQFLREALPVAAS